MDWFVRRGNVVEGPLAETDLRRMVLDGALSPDTPASPNRIDYHPLHAWTAFFPDGTLEAFAFLAADETNVPEASAPLAPRGRTAIVGTEGPYVAEALPVFAGKGTAVFGTPERSAPETVSEPWPGATQSDPDAQASFRSEVAPARKDPEPLPAPHPIEPSSSPRAVERPVPRPLAFPVPPVKSAPEWLPIILAAALTLLLLLGGMMATDRLLNGPATSNISRYLPRDASAYLEIPSVKRWARGFSGVDFLKDDALANDAWLQALRQQDPRGGAPTTSLIEHVESIGLARVGEATHYAVLYDGDPAIDAEIALQVDRSDTEWGPRYFRSPQNECLWIQDERVELCVAGGGLDVSLEVLSGSRPSAEDDAYLRAAKKRSWSSYLPFVDPPALYAVLTPSSSAEHPALGQLSQAIIKAGVDDLGYFEAVDLVWPPGSAPAGSLSAPPTFYDTLPEGTVFYANFRATPPRTAEALAEQLERLSSFAPGAPPTEELAAQIRQRLGFDPSALFAGLGDEGLVALSAPPGARLHQENSDVLRGAVWWMQSVDDPAEVRRTVRSLVERFSEERSGLTWKDENNLVADGPNGMRVHLRFERGRLRLGLGQKEEIARVLAGGGRLRDDPAHARALDDLDPEGTVVAWLDLGRVLGEPDLVARPSFPPELLRAVRTEGPERPVSAWGVRRFETGDLRVRSRNFPTGLLLLLIATVDDLPDLSHRVMKSGGETPLTGMDDPSQDDLAAPPSEGEPGWIGPGSDGTFRLPPP